MLLNALLHPAVALKRTSDVSLNYSVASKKTQLGNFWRDLAHFMTIIPFQFRFYARSCWTASGLQASIIEDHAEEFNWPSPGC